MMKPALLLPLRFVDTTDIDDSFDGNFAQNQVKNWQMGLKCYLQKYQRTDHLTLQIISDTVPSDLQIYAEDRTLYTSIAWTASTTQLLGEYVDSVIYEIDQPLFILNEGSYIFVQDNFESQAVEVLDFQPNTILLKYKNSVNDKDVVFSTGIEFQFRVEAYIGAYQPKNDRDVYVNQQYSPFQLKSVAHRQFTLSIGYGAGVPEWVLDKVNIITQCDEVHYNDIKYQPIDGAEFEVIRADDLVSFIGAKIDIEPSQKYIKFETGTNPQEKTITPVQKVKPYLSRSADFSASGLFKFNSVLEYVNIYNYSAGLRTVKIGTTPNGDEIGSFDIDEIDGKVYLVDYPFLTNTTVYVSGINGADLDFWFVWKQLDEQPIPVNGGGGSSAENLGKGACISWKGTIVDFNDTWDKSTGLGKPNTLWSKWTIAGKNGTEAMDNTYQIGIDTSAVGQDYTSLGSIVGANTYTLSKANLPAVGINLFSAGAGGRTKITPTTPVSAARSTTDDRYFNYDMSIGSYTPSLGLSANLGEGASIDNKPRSIISLFVIKIQD